MREQGPCYAHLHKLQVRLRRAQDVRTALIQGGCPWPFNTGHTYRDGAINPERHGPSSQLDW